MNVNDPHFSNHSWITRLRNKLFPQKRYRVSISALESIDRAQCLPSSRPGTPFESTDGRSETPNPERPPYQLQYDAQKHGHGIAPQWRSGTPFGSLQSPLRGMDGPSVRHVPDVALSAESALLSVGRSLPWPERNPRPRNPYPPSGEFPPIHSEPSPINGSSVVRPNVQRATASTGQPPLHSDSTTPTRVLQMSDSPSAFSRPRVAALIAPPTSRTLGGG